MTNAYNPATRPCSGKVTKGCAALQQRTLAFFPQATNLGTYICRQSAGGSPSVHGNGRAGDIGCRGELGQDIADWLVANHSALGVQLVIWNHRIWSVAHADEGWRPYGCDKPGSKLDHHTTHVHWEVNIDAGEHLTVAIIDSVRPGHPGPPPLPEPPIPEELLRMDFFILNDNNTATQDQWYWWPELGGDKGTKAIIPSGEALTLAKKSDNYVGSLEFDRPDLDAIPALRA